MNDVYEVKRVKILFVNGIMEKHIFVVFFFDYRAWNIDLLRRVKTWAHFFGSRFCVGFGFFCFCQIVHKHFFNVKFTCNSFFFLSFLHVKHETIHKQIGRNIFLMRAVKKLSTLDVFSTIFLFFLILREFPCEFMTKKYLTWYNVTSW